MPPLTPVCIFLPIPFFTSLSYPTQAHLHPPNITASIPPLLVFNLLSLHLEYLFHFYLFYSPLYFYLSQFLLLLFCLAISFLPFLLFIPPRWQEDAMPGAERGSGSWGNGGENRICILQLSWGRVYFNQSFNKMSEGYIQHRVLEPNGLYLAVLSATETRDLWLKASGNLTYWHQNSAT